MKLYFIAGELSGDYIGSKIIAHIKESAKDIEICGVGGEKMLEAGLKKSFFAMKQISLFGLFEIIPHIFRLRKLIDSTVADIVKQGPKVLITIDSPGFCFRVAERVKKIAPEIIRIHIVAPSVWAYKPERAIKVASIYNHLLTLLPFEPPLFEKYGLKTSFIGHPFFEQTLPSSSEIEQFRADNDLPLNTIAITPGSRAGEIKRHLPVFIQSIIEGNLDKCHILIVSSTDEHNRIIKTIMAKYKLPYIITDQKLKAFQSAKLVLAKSGTNTLEVAFCGTAMIVGYKLNPLTWWWIRRFIKIQYASLINIIAGLEIIPEYIQDKFTSQNLAQAIVKLFNEKAQRKKQIDRYSKIIQEMGVFTQISPSQRAAKIILSYLEKNK